jgi:hypothetical protein
MDKNVLRLGGNTSIGLGLCYVLVGLTFFMVPAEQLKGFSPEFWPSYVQGPFWRQVFQFTQALGATLGVAVVLGVREWSQKRNEGWLGWASVLAYVGFALGIIDNVRSFELERLQGAIFMSADAATQASIVANKAINNLDSMGVLGFGAVGFWVVVASLTLNKSGMISAGQKALGWAVALLMWMVVIGYGTGNTVFLSVAAGFGGFVAAPVYFIWLGLGLRGAAAGATSAPAAATVKSRRRRR